MNINIVSIDELLEWGNVVVIDVYCNEMMKMLFSKEIFC